MNTICLGVLKPASRDRQCAISACSVISRPGRSTTNARGTSPQRGSGMATTAASSTASHSYRARSTSDVATFSPPETIMSFLRSSM